MKTEVGSSNRFSDRVLRLLERVEHRCAITHAEKNAVYELRRRTKIRQRLTASGAEDQLYDKAFDDASNAWATMTFIDGELASTLRVHVAADEKDPLPSLGAFSDVIMPRLRSWCVIVDATRPAAQLEFARSLPELPYIALRPAWLAAEYFEADFILATVVEQHQAFYGRAFGYQPWCEPRGCLDFNDKATCMGLDFRAAKERIEKRYPFFRSTRGERDALFRRSAERPTHLPKYPDSLVRMPPTAQ